MKGEQEMTTEEVMETQEAAEETKATALAPLWLAIEQQLLELNSANFSGDAKEDAIRKVAGQLDDAGYTVSTKGGNLLKVRWAMDDMIGVGRPLMKDFNEAIAALTLEDVLDPYAATTDLIAKLGDTWEELKQAARRRDIIDIVEDARLNLLVKKAKEMDENASIRYLIGEDVEDELIIDKLEITAESLAGVHDQIAKEKAEKKRVAGLLAKVEDKSDVEKVKHLINENVAEELIIEMAGVDKGVIADAQKAMEEEIKEKQRLAEEEAARKAAEAAGPALEDISSDDMIDYIDAIREIMEFSDVEKEIRVMCEQSSIPQALVDIAVSDPDKLDELEKQAEG